MKDLARIHVWWAGIDAEIERTVKECGMCQSVAHNPPQVLVHPWAWPTRIWQRIHVDFAGPFMGETILVVVDARTKWVEAVTMKSTTSEKTITVLREMFSRYGLPEQLVSDNGPQFVSVEFETFCKSNGIKHLRSPPYHPASNGQAERFVQTLKLRLKTMSKERNFEHKLSSVLLQFRCTPHATTGVSPAELFMQRKIRTRLDLLRPDMATRVMAKQTLQERNPWKHSFREFAVGQPVWARNYRGTSKWVAGEIMEQLSPVS